MTMPDYVSSGKTFKKRVNFIVNGDFVVPDEGTQVSFSVFDITNPNVALYESSVECGKTFCDLTVPAENNVLSDGAKFSRRKVFVDFTNNGGTSTSSFVYTVVSFVPAVVTCDDVRIVFGLNDSDLPDELIDLTGKYFELVSEYPKVESLFYESGRLCDKANRMLSLYCALNYANGLSLLAVGSETDGTNKITRFEKGLDFAAQKAAVESEFNDLVSELVDEVDPATSSVDGFIVVTTEDIFTGE